MNILFLTTHLNTGGITSYLYTLGKELVQAGHNVFIVSSGGNMAVDFKNMGMKLYTFNIRTKSELSPKIYKNLSKVEKIVHELKIDIIHAQTRVTQVMATMLSKRCSVPYVSTCHGYFKRRLSRRLFPCWGRAVIAISEPVKRHLLEDFKIDDNKIELIENGIDRSQFVFQNKDARKKNRKELGLEDNFIVGLIARLSDVKGQDILIEAMAEVVLQYPKARLLLIGQGKEGVKLKTQVKRLKLADSVVFLPTVNQTAEMLAAFDIFAMPSRAEGLGLSVLEAQASGVACITSNVGGLPSLITHEKTGLLVNKENPAALATAIVRLIENPNLRERLAKEANESMGERWSSGYMAKKVINLYKKMIGKSCDPVTL